MIIDPSEPSGARGDAYAWWTFVGVAVALLPLMIDASFDFGVTWDEKARHKYGEMVWEYLRGMRPRSDFVDDGGNLYGGLFDTLCAAIERFVPANRYVVRHALNATFGWVGILYSGRLAARLWNRWAGVLAMVLLAASPRYLGDAMNNPKDLPFAALCAAALFYISTVSPRFPYVSRATGVKTTIALALALNVRAGALLYLGYFGLLVLGYAVAERNFSVRRLADTGARLAVVSVAVLVLGTAFWPWARDAPLIRPLQALLGFANFPYGGSMLYAGKVIDTDRLPADYVPWWFLISTPPVVILGVLFAAAARRRERSLALLLVGSVAALPLVLVIVMRSTLYDGVRHLLFVYPMLVVIAACGWVGGLDRTQPLWRRRLAGGLLAAGLLDVAAYEFRSYPNETTYFNQIVGGPRGAFGRYDMDYWGNCLLEAVAWTARTAQASGIAVTVSGEPWQLIQLDAERFHQLLFTPLSRGEHQLDIRLARGPADAVQALATRPDALYRVQTADGAVLCVVIPGPTYWQLQPRLVLPPPDLSTRRLLGR